ncbi:MAG: toll/interleukin-1 receptor domain-containing protein [Pseudorhodoplanes sp.]
MSQQPVNIFVSYAWKDNTFPPDDPYAKKGFVTALCEQLEYELNAYAPAPTLWRDGDNIDPAQQHDPIIETQIKNSSLLLIVLSNNWMASDYCAKELEMFRERWQHESDFDFGHRIILVHKAPTPRTERAKVFPIQLGFEFYRISERDGIATPYWHRGRGEPQFFEKTVELGGILAKRANAVVGRRPPRAPQPADLPPDAPTVYLAKPGADMRQAYLRLHKELTDQKYRVLPAPDAELPRDASAIQIVDDALKNAVASIHVFGSSMGLILDSKESVVAMQLGRAEHAINQTQHAGAAHQPPLRLIWAPKSFQDLDGNVVERDSVDAFTTIGTLLDTDALEAGDLEQFVISAKQRLRQIPRRDEKKPVPIGTKEKVYLCHAESDSLYAAKIARLLQQGNIRYVMSAYFNTDDSEQKRHHRRKLSECAAVMMCWASASEEWATSLADELEDWQALGRVKEFTTRALIAGPPPHLRKDRELLHSLFPKNEIDHVLDFTKLEPSLEAIASIFGAAASPAQ